MENQTRKKKMEVLEAAFASSVGIYYSLNLTRDIVPGVIYQVVGGKRYNINEQMGMGENARFSDMAAYWSNFITEDREAFLAFSDVESLLDRFRRGQTHVSFRYWIQNVVQEPMLAEEHIIMYTDEETGDVLAIAYVLDLTQEYREEEYKRELEKSHKELEEALQAAQHANQAKTTFLNSMSHDIRTPMNAIIGFTSLAASHINNTDKVKEYLRKIAASSEHLLSLINDVLDMSRIESGKVKIDEKPLHLPELLHDIRTIIQPTVTSKQLDFLIDTVDVIDEDIIADKLRLTQILLNILGNGIKFNKTGGTVSLRIKQARKAPTGYATYHFIIRDTGIGISKEFQQHIFESFTRAETSTVSGIPGTGLGLSITKRIVDMMGGTISVKSEEGIGSEFDVCLTFRLSGEKKVYEKVPSLQGLRVLVADDDTDTCLSISSMLTEIGMRSEWTVSGREAVVRTQHALDMGDEFYAYIIDWLMPDMNGIETVRRIRKVIGDSRPIIILTAYDWADVEQEAREAGVTAFCEKPLFLSELRDLLSQPHPVEPVQEVKRTLYKGKTVLLVEDNQLNQEIAAAILEEAGIHTEIAPDGRSAVEAVENSKPGDIDLVLMDIQMPVMDGYEATKAIRASSKEHCRAIPIVAMTANAFEEDRERALKSGMDGYVAKPIQISKLMEAIDAVLK